METYCQKFVIEQGNFFVVVNLRFDVLEQILKEKA